MKMGKKCGTIKKTCPNCGKEYFIYPSEENKRGFCCIKCRSEYNTCIKICIECGKEFKVPNSRKNSAICCSDVCRKTYNYKQSLETRVCKCCNKEFSISKSSHDLCCSNECYIIWKGEHCKIKYNCDYCDKEFEILKSKVDSATGGLYCCHKCSTDANIKGSILKCTNCGKEIYKMQSQIQNCENNFCSQECACEYSHKNNSHEQECEYCHKIYDVKNSNTDSRFCCMDCKNKWQSEFLVGKDNPCYKSKQLKCACCGKDIYVKPYRLQTGQNKHFCSYECTRKYYSISKNRTLKQKIADKIFAVSSIKHTKDHMTEPHKIINDYLNSEKITYRNEELVTYYKMDMYLPDYNLGIEVNGDYWHSNPIRYSEIQYERQLKGIHRDKSKHTYVKNKYNYEILYLWENDIHKHLDVCEKLIQEYIKRNGILDNYHSFNYYIDELGELKINKILIIPYQEYNRSDLPVNLKDKVS